MKKAARKGQITARGRLDVTWGIGYKLLFENDGGVHVRGVRTKSSFERYRGIGSPGMVRGKKAAVRCVRELRGA